MANFFSWINPEYALPLMIKAAGILFALIMVWRWRRPGWRYFAFAVLFVLTLRLILFSLPQSWEFYMNHLGVDDLGWRQQSTLAVEYYKFFKAEHPKKYMAVGSSQSYAIYTPYSKKHNHLIVFNLAGMTPLDMYFYRNYIVARKSEVVLLYLSEFDIAKDPSLDAVKIGPGQGFGLLDVLPALYRISKMSGTEIAFNEIIAGEFLPEYKYSYIFKGFLDNATGKRQALQQKSLYAEISPDKEEVARVIEDLVSRADERWIAYNTLFLEKFLAYCRDKGQKVIIVEGQYHPAAYTSKTLALNLKVRGALERLDRELDNVTFIPRSQTPVFTAEDYKDSVHVKDEAGVRYAEQLISWLDKNMENNL